MSDWGIPIQMAVLADPPHPKYEVWLHMLTKAVFIILQMSEEPQVLVDATDELEGEYPIFPNFTMRVKGLSIRKRIEEAE